MDGLTTIEEEKQLAEYFRTHEVSDQWQEYKEMFAWFDKGMPTSDRQAQDSTSKTTLQIALTLQRLSTTNEDGQ